MTITINEYLLYYWAFAIVFETIYVYIIYKIWIRPIKEKGDPYTILKEIFNSSKQASIFSLLFNPYSYFVMYVLFCILTPLLFPMSLFSIIKKIVGWKSKKQKREAVEGKAYQEAKKAEDEYQKNGGMPPSFE